MTALNLNDITDNHRKLFIELVQERPIIWDPNHAEHKKRTALNSAYIDVSDQAAAVDANIPG